MSVLKVYKKGIYNSFVYRDGNSYWDRVCLLMWS